MVLLSSSVIGWVGQEGTLRCALTIWRRRAAVERGRRYHVSIRTDRTGFMEIRVEAGDITQSDAGAIVVNLFEGVTRPVGATGAVDRALDGAISTLIAQGACKGRKDEHTLVHTLNRLPSPRVIVAGLGSAERFDIDRVRSTSAAVARYVRRSGARSAATIVHGAGIGGLDAEAAAEALTVGSILGSYRFLKHKRRDEDAPELETLTVVEADAARLPAIERGVERGRIMARAAAMCRDMANEPGNHLTPTMLAERATDLAVDASIEVEVHDRTWMEEKGMGALLGVASGSQEPPRFIVMRYAGGGAREGTLGLVGKGITFDSGGISIKPAAKMPDMKADMSGGAAVITALWAIARLGLPINVVGIVPATENLPSGSALKPGDVIRAMNGKTIEVINTDAEGRLILADGLGYAQELGASPIVDIATLTGAATSALGPYAAGILGNDDALCSALIEAAEASGERLWPMPMYDDYDDLIKSDVADVKNSGGPAAGMSTAARFLFKFIDRTPWAHIDIASVDMASRDQDFLTKGATGYGVLTLVNYARARAASAAAAPAAAAES
ncbi:MAG: leucyl aminopeptidase [Dehalococcoidia bacterium]|nr:leucyl aminopeptidase [Dehalococcoidia bacterium]